MGSRRAVSVMAASLLVAAGAGGVALWSGVGQEDERGTEAEAEARRTPTSADASAPTTTAPPAATVPPDTAAPETTAPLPGRTWSITPTRGPAGTRVTLQGSGCEGPNANVTITYLDGDGNPYDGDGVAARPDGTWSTTGAIGSVPRGDTFVEAACTGGRDPFAYSPRLVFTVTR